MPRYVTELVGTYFLVLFVGLAVVPASPFAPLTIGLGLTALVYMGGPVSGAHYNPAVTIAFRVQGHMRSGDLFPYLAVQFVGAALATLTVGMLLGATFAPAPAVDASIGAVLAVEFVFTFLLMLVILNVAVPEEVKGNQYYGVAIGLTIAAAAFAGGGISGGAYNPAVGLGTALVHGFAGHEWIYLVGPIAGSLAAVPVFALQRGVPTRRD
jgi:aquaporin Z